MGYNVDAVRSFEERIFSFETPIVDPDGSHHEFNQGLHGQKVDFGNITEGSELYSTWIDVQTGFIAAQYPRELWQSMVLAGVAYGTNGVARDVALALGDGVQSIETTKNDSGLPEPTTEATEQLETINPQLVVIVEDVITLGTNSVSTLTSIHTHRPPGLKQIEVVGTLLRSMPQRLIELNVAYAALIKRPMKVYAPDACRREGFCAEGWQLTPYKR